MDERMEQANQTVRRSRRALRAQLKKLSWLGETQAALGWGVVLLLAALVGTLYVSQASRIAGTGRAVQLMQRRLEDLKRENNLLERQIAEAQSLELLEQRAQSLGFVQPLPDDLEYLVVDNYPPAVATAAPVALRPLEPPAETIWEALWWQFGAALRSLVQGESNEQ